MIVTILIYKPRNEVVAVLVGAPPGAVYPIWVRRLVDVVSPLDVLDVIAIDPDSRRQRLSISSISSVCLCGWVTIGIRAARANCGSIVDGLCDGGPRPFDDGDRLRREIYGAVVPRLLAISSIAACSAGLISCPPSLCALATSRARLATKPL